MPDVHISEVRDLDGDVVTIIDNGDWFRLQISDRHNPRMERHADLSRDGLKAIARDLNTYFLNY